MKSLNKLTAVIALASLCAIPTPSYSLTEMEPWDDKMDITLDPNSLVGVSGRFRQSQQGSGVTYQSFGNFSMMTPYMKNENRLLGARGKINTTMGCDGINLSTVYSGQIDQFIQVFEALLQDIPGMALMWLAQTQPIFQRVLDMLNQTVEFGLDTSNLTCEGLQDALQDNVFDKPADHAKDACISEAGYNSSECLAGDQIEENLLDKIEEAKEKLNEWTDGFTNGGQEIPTIYDSPEESTKCGSFEEDSYRSLLFAASKLKCEIVDRYTVVLPDYKIKEGDTELEYIEPTELIDDIHRMTTDQYYLKIDQIVDLYGTDGITEELNKFYLKTGFHLFSTQLKQLSELKKTYNTQYHQVLGEVAALGSFRELTFIIDSLDRGLRIALASNGEGYVLPEQAKEGFEKAIEGLRLDRDSLERRLSYESRLNNAVDEMYSIKVYRK